MPHAAADEGANGCTEQCSDEDSNDGADSARRLHLSGTIAVRLDPRHLRMRGYHVLVHGVHLRPWLWVRW